MEKLIVLMLGVGGAVLLSYVGSNQCYFDIRKFQVNQVLVDRDV